MCGVLHTDCSVLFKQAVNITPRFVRYVSIRLSDGVRLCQREQRIHFGGSPVGERFECVMVRRGGTLRRSGHFNRRGGNKET